MISPETTARVRKVAEHFAAADKSLFLVGGIVRDSILGLVLDGGDIDLATDARPAQTKQLVSDIAEAVWAQGERFGTIGCLIDGVPFEITTFRGESYDVHSRKPEVVFTNALETDLSRRDFTINAIAIDALTHEVHDPFGGEGDLKAQILRTPLSSEVSFSDDPLRMLRAARFVARFDLTVLPEIELAISQQRDRLAIVSSERVRDELFKLLAVKNPRRGLQFLLDQQLLGRWLPELASQTVEGNPRVGVGQIFDAVASSPVELTVRVAALLFDLNEDLSTSPHTRATLAHDRLGELRCSSEQRRQIATVIEIAARILDLVAPASDSDIRRIVRDARVDLELAVTLAQSLASVGAPGRSKNSVQEFSRRQSDLGENHDDLGPELDGREVIQVLGGGPGAHVGKALNFLGEVRLTNGIVGREESIRLLRQWWDERNNTDSD